MKRYSVWNPSGATWDYYTAQGDLRAGVFASDPRMPSGHALGLSPDEAARSLPVGATLVGRGPVAVGMIASRSRPQALGFLGIDGSTLTRVAVWGGIGYLVWTYWLSDASKAKTRSYLRPKRRR